MASDVHLDHGGRIQDPSTVVAIAIVPEELLKPWDELSGPVREGIGETKYRYRNISHLAASLVPKHWRSTKLAPVAQRGMTGQVIFGGLTVKGPFDPVCGRLVVFNKQLNVWEPIRIKSARRPLSWNEIKKRLDPRIDPHYVRVELADGSKAGPILAGCGEVTCNVRTPIWVKNRRAMWNDPLDNGAKYRRLERLMLRPVIKAMRAEARNEARENTLYGQAMRWQGFKTFKESLYMFGTHEAMQRAAPFLVIPLVACRMFGTRENRERTREVALE